MNLHRVQPDLLESGESLAAPQLVQGPLTRRGWFSLRQSAIWISIAAGSFYVAYLVPQAAYLSIIYLFALLQVARADTWRGAFYSGLAIGLVTAAVRLTFFWMIFGSGAVVLWLVYAFWIGVFVVLARLSLLRLPRPWNWVMVPLLWCGLEYFRSELYYLRFSWLSPGFAFGAAPWMISAPELGTYGIGCVLMAVACIACSFWRRSKLVGLCSMLVGVAGFLVLSLLTQGEPKTPPFSSVHVAGVQMEFPTESEVLARLNGLIRAVPNAQLIVLSEYTFNAPVPEKIRNWCRTHQRYLVVGGKEPAAQGDFYDMAYVVSPTGEIVFRQGKSVPIQFFKDGLPAPDQKIWNSPWGKLGICVCYDLSYSRVTDRLVRQKAQALIVPTMDVVDWGVRQHELHALVAPIRAREYRLPIFRVASSGISQLVDAGGRLRATAPCPGDGALVSGALEIRGPGKLPPDRWLAPLATGVTAGFVLLCVATRNPRRRSKSNRKEAPEE